MRRVLSVRTLTLVLSLVVLAALAYIQLWAPFSGDQALFMLIAEELAQGARLYVDVWDIKQPGIFYFFLFSGRLFSFDEAGVHLLESLFLLTSAFALAMSLRGRWRSTWVVGLLPILLVGAYYTVPDANLLTQVESLAGPAIVASILFFRAGVTRNQGWLVFLAGAAAGAVGLLKLLYVPIPIVGWWLASRTDGHRTELVGVKRVALAGTGLIATLGVVAFLMVGAEALSEALWTWFVYPFEVLQVHARPLSRLTRSLLGFSALYLPLLALALFSLASPRRTDWLTKTMWAWVGLGSISFILQKWHVYLLMILTVPLAVMAADGVDRLSSEWARRSRKSKIGAGLGIVLVSVISLYFGMARLGQWLAAGSGSTLEARVDYQHAIDEDTASLIIEAAYLETLPDGEVLVFGDPRITYFADRRQSGAYSGWSWRTWNDLLWNRALRSWLMDSPSSVFIEAGQASSLLSASPGLESMLAERYAPTRVTAAGTWYVRSTLLGEVFGVGVARSSPRSSHGPVITPKPSRAGHGLSIDAGLEMNENRRSTACSRADRIPRRISCIATG